MQQEAKSRERREAAQREGAGADAQQRSLTTMALSAPVSVPNSPACASLWTTETRLHQSLAVRVPDLGLQSHGGGGRIFGKSPARGRLELTPRDLGALLTLAQNASPNLGMRAPRSQALLCRGCAGPESPD